MYKHILVAVDGSELADRAMAHGSALAKMLDARVTAVTVTPNWSPLEMAHKSRSGSVNAISDYEKAEANAANVILDAAVRTAKGAGINCDVVHLADLPPAEGIIKAAKERVCDLIVMASHGRRGVGRLLLGSQASEVVAYATVPILIVR